MRETSPYAGMTVQLRADAKEIGGQPCEVVDWYVNVAGRTWHEALTAGDPKADGYNIRHGMAGLPDDDEVLFGRVDGMTMLVHVTEVEGASSAATPNAWGPKVVDDQAIGLPCPACQVLLVAGDLVAVLPLGPGLNPVEREKARSGEPYTAVVVELHWPCATGQEL